LFTQPNMRRFYLLTLLASTATVAWTSAAAGAAGVVRAQRGRYLTSPAASTPFGAISDRGESAAFVSGHGGRGQAVLSRPVAAWAIDASDFERSVRSSLRSPRSTLSTATAAVRGAAAPQASKLTAQRIPLFNRRGAAGLVPTVEAAWSGLSFPEAGGDPPDPQVAAGAGSVVEMVNAAVRVWTAGGLLRATYPMAPFFLASSSAVSDPRVLFDPTSGRWFAIVIDIYASAIKIAVSTTSDPAQPWLVYTTPLAVCPDQPSLGVSSSLVLVGYFGFSSCGEGATPLGGGFFVENKQQLITGGVGYYTYWNPGPAGPVVAVQQTPDPARAVAPAARDVLFLFSFSGLPTDTATATLSYTFAQIAPLTSPPPAVQLGSAAPIITNDGRLLQAVTDVSTTWVAGNSGCVPQGDSAIHSCLRLIAINGGAAVAQGDIGIAGYDLFYPAIQLDGAGDLIIAHGFSSPNDYPSLAVTARLADGSLAGVAVARGTAPTGSTRYGDYFGAAPDPNEPGAVWVAGQIGEAPTGSAHDWGTAVARVRVGPAAAPPPPPPPPPAPPPPVPRPPAGTPTPARPPVIQNSGSAPEVPVAGKRFVFGVVVVEKNTQKRVTSGGVRCFLRVGNTSLSPFGKGFVRGDAVCGWKIPATAARKRVTGAITVAHLGKSVTQRFARKVAPAASK
jgi:hypothetical protein